MKDSTKLWESRATHGELKAEYEHRWPAMRRRWRVEGSAGGNSFLVTRPRANEAQARYGGVIHEVLVFDSLARRQALPMGLCPYCEAPKGEPCQTKTNNERVPHQARWDEFNE